jgi:hypothetical protein
MQGGPDAIRAAEMSLVAGECGRGRAQAGRGAVNLLLALALIALAAWGWWRYYPQTLPESLRPQRPVAPPPAASPTLYKWKDDQGLWNITDHPPKGRAFEAVVVDPNTNVVPSSSPPEQNQ